MVSLEGFAEESKLIFGGEESSPRKRAIHLESGLRVVQLLDLGSFETSTEERGPEESSTLNASETRAHGVSSLPSHQTAQETLPKGESEYDDVSDISDEGTPERDLPGKVFENLKLMLKCDIIFFTVERGHSIDFCYCSQSRRY